MHQKLIEFNKTQRRAFHLPKLQAGDVVKISRKIKEGSKERLQAFQGMVIALRGGQSASKTITVRKVSSGVGVELVLPLNSPQIEKIEFVKRTTARRAKLYFVRDKSVKVLNRKLKAVALKDSEKPLDMPVAAEEPEEELVQEEIALETAPAVEEKTEEAKKDEA